mgnify:CR=1 FL=1
MLLKLTIILLFALILLCLRNWLKLNRKKNFFKSKKLITFNKKNLNNWMNLTKKERYNLSKQESISYLDKRKLLLDEIRKEYKKISRGDSQENIKKK